MEDFKSFITESSDEKYKVVVLTRKPEQVGVKPVCATSARIEEEAKKMKIFSARRAQDLFLP